MVTGRTLTVTRFFVYKARSNLVLNRIAATEFQLCCVTSAWHPEHIALVCKDAVDELLLRLLVVRRLLHWRAISQVSQRIAHHSRLDVAAAIRCTAHCWLVHRSLLAGALLTAGWCTTHCWLVHRSLLAGAPLTAGWCTARL